MYNKLFTKILDSSIWLEPTPTRIVWLTFLASMDESGFVQLTSPANVAHRARVTLDEACNAIGCLESPDRESGDPENEGRRVERVPGGWMVLNSGKYRELVTKVVIQAQTRERVRKHRARKRDRSNAHVTVANETVTPSEAIAVSREEDRSTQDLDHLERENPSTSAGNGKPASLSPAARVSTDGFTDPAVTERAGRFIERYESLYQANRKGARYTVRPVRDYAASVTLCRTWGDDGRLDKLAVIFLNSDHKFAEEGSRTIPQFLALASWCDGKLAEHEAQVKS